MADIIWRQNPIDDLEKTKSAKSEDGEIYIAKTNEMMSIDALPFVHLEQKNGEWLNNYNGMFECEKQTLSELWRENEIWTI